MRFCLLIALLFTSPAFSQNPLDRIANSLEEIENNQAGGRLDRLAEQMNRDSISAMNIQQMQAAIINLQQQNLVLSRQLADANNKNKVNQDWFERLKDHLSRGDAAAISIQLSEFSKAFVRRRVDMRVDIKSR